MKPQGTKAKNDRDVLESLDVNDFELVNDSDNINSGKIKEPVQEKDTDNKERRKKKNEEYKRLVEEMKNEMEPFKDELLNDQKVLEKMHSNLIDENKKKEGGEQEHEDSEADLRYKVSSMKYDLTKKERLIDELQNKMKRIHEKMDHVTNDSKNSPDDFQCILLLKKELELLDENETGTLENNRAVKSLDLDAPKNLAFNFSYLFIGSCFHVVNAILIVILLSMYYSRDSYSEKQFTIFGILGVYLAANSTSIYLSKFYFTQFRSTVYTKDERKKKLLYHITLLLACLTACILMVCHVAKRYEDASTFIYNMLYLMGFCFLVNAILALIICKFAGSLDTQHFKSLKNQPKRD